MGPLAPDNSSVRSWSRQKDQQWLGGGFGSCSVSKSLDGLGMRLAMWVISHLHDGAPVQSLNSWTNTWLVMLYEPPPSHTTRDNRMSPLLQHHACSPVLCLLLFFTADFSLCSILQSQSLTSDLSVTSGVLPATAGFGVIWCLCGWRYSQPVKLPYWLFLLFILWDSSSNLKDIKSSNPLV